MISWLFSSVLVLAVMLSSVVPVCLVISPVRHASHCAKELSTPARPPPLVLQQQPGSYLSPQATLAQGVDSVAAELEGVEKLSDQVGTFR